MNTDGIEGLFATIVIILVIGIIGGIVCGVVSLCTHEDVCDITATVEIVETKSLDEGYAYCLRGECLDGDVWFRINSDAFYLDTCNNKTVSLRKVQTKDVFGTRYRYTLINGEDNISAYTISI